MVSRISAKFWVMRPWPDVVKAESIIGVGIFSQVVDGLATEVARELLGFLGRVHLPVSGALAPS